MKGGRPRTVLGTYGAIQVVCHDGRYTASTRYRDLDGRLRRVRATATAKSQAAALLKQRLLDRPGFGGAGLLDRSSPFGALAEAWLADLELRELAPNTKDNYREDLARYVQPVFQHYTLGEITTGRVEWFLKREAAVSYSRAKHSRTMLNLLFGFALRQDAVPRNPVEGCSPLKKPKGAPQALSLEQIAAIRAAAAVWRTGPAFKGPKPDGKVRDLIEVLLGTGLRPGEALAIRRCDVAEVDGRMLLHVRGTVILRTGEGAVRQDHPKTEHSVRRVAVPEFAAAVIRQRMTVMGSTDPSRTIFANRAGAPLSPYNVRRTFRGFLDDAGLGDSGISPRWYRRTAATVVARGISAGAAATLLGHGSTAITEDYYIQPDATVDTAPSDFLERTLRPHGADGSLLARPGLGDEDDLLDLLDEDETDPAG